MGQKVLLIGVAQDNYGFVPLGMVESIFEQGFWFVCFFCRGELILS